MMKKLLFMAALLVPGLAYGQYPSANLSVQVVPASNNIACAIGPNYTGSIPAGAAAAGFTTCMANFDFTSPFFSSLSNWLDCAGASSPILYNNAGGASCSAYSIVNDGGTTALRIRLPTGTSGPTYAVLNTVSASNNAGQLFPQTAYIEYGYRLVSNADSLCTYSGDCDAMQFFRYPLTGTPSNVPWWEWDYTEVYTNATNGYPPTGTTAASYSNVTFGFNNNLAQYNATGQKASTIINYVATSDQTVYHNYAVRVASDGAGSLDGTVPGHISFCFYSEGVQGICSAGTYNNNAGSPQDSMVLRELITYQNVIPPGVSLAGNQDIFVEYFRIWGCPAWQAATPLTTNGNNCLNTSADVTGKLAGPP